MHFGPSSDDVGSVFVLVIVAQERNPEPVVFDSISKLYQHLADLVFRHIDKYEERFAIPLLKYRKDSEFQKFIALWKHARLENGKPTGFDAFWEERPQVVL